MASEKVCYAGQPVAGIFPSTVNTHGALTLVIGAEGTRRKYREGSLNIEAKVVTFGGKVCVSGWVWCGGEQKNTGE